MKNLANLNSAEWCDIIFENKNKEYGAFELRQSAWKRYIMAFAVIVTGVVLVSFLPGIITDMTAKTISLKTDINEIYKMTEIDNTKKDLINEIVQSTALAEPPKYVKMEKFVPPTIVPDDKVTDEDETMKGMSQMTETNTAIGAFEVEKGSTDADAIRKEFERQVVGEGSGEGGGEKKPEILTVAQFMPLFPGGEAELYKYISDNLRYPIVDQEMGTQGRVTIRFVVNQTGEISDIQLLKGISPGCDKEALRVVKSMPKWVPGRQNGNPVSVYFTLPIVFQLKKG